MNFVTSNFEDDIHKMTACSIDAFFSVFFIDCFNLLTNILFFSIARVAGLLWYTRFFKKARKKKLRSDKSGYLGQMTFLNDRILRSVTVGVIS